MSVSDVTARIAQIQAQLVQLGDTGGATTTASTGTGTTSASEFASALDSSLAAVGGSTDSSFDGAGATAAAGGASTGGSAVVAEARKYLGLPYVWGGESITKGVDCSGLVQSVYKTLGYDLPRLSADQARSGRKVESMAQAQPGDLIAWNNSSRNSGADHIAIYIGDGKMIEAPRTGLKVRIVDVPSTPDYIRRVLPDSGVASASRVSGAAPARVAAGTPYANLFSSAAAKYDLPATLLSAVAKQESGYNPRAVSPAGAQGLMQLMPGTAKGLGVTNSFDPAQAVDGAARMLRDLTRRFGSTELALAAYNAGPGAVLKYNGVPPYPETQRYVRNVMSMMKAAS
ncbi:transglycosylase SLT domain-containing protein [Marmoricola sp. RAF53]|uniref:transglycosylase SLT domain-containing protein n=1 Tax=Marmoricola sp. RAF53 TaxID=3233059 RepID=UPI003F9AE0F7